MQKELQSGILSYGLACGEAVEGLSLVKGSHVRLEMNPTAADRPSEPVDDLNRPCHLIILPNRQSVR